MSDFTVLRHFTHCLSNQTNKTSSLRSKRFWNGCKTKYHITTTHQWVWWVRRTDCLSADWTDSPTDRTWVRTEQDRRSHTHHQRSRSCCRSSDQDSRQNSHRLCGEYEMMSDVCRFNLLKQKTLWKFKQATLY